MNVLPYAPSFLADWERVVSTARNATFLHRRSFLEYHSDRFVDSSFLVVDDNNKVITVLPATRDGDTLVSHGGLTYGAILLPPQVAQLECMNSFEVMVQYWRDCGIRRLVYKAVPHIFHSSPAEEDLYALTRLGASLHRREVASVIDLRVKLAYSKGRKWSVKRAKKSGIVFRQGLDFGPFHLLLCGVLKRHDASPVHSLDELELLSSRFPDGIRLFEVSGNGELLAGALVFDFGRVVHTQYLAVSEEGRRVGALDFLIDNLIEKVFFNRSFFSFGISTEQHGNILNEGLQRQKEGFGARAIMHDTYLLSL